MPLMVSQCSADTHKVGRMQRVLRPGGPVVAGIWQGLDNNPVYDPLVESNREVVDEKSADSVAWPFTMGDVGRLEDIFSIDGLSDISITSHDRPQISMFLL